MSKRVAYVTGGMGGIGTSICRKLHDAGFTVIAGCGPSRTMPNGWPSRRPMATPFMPRSATSPTGTPRSRPLTKLRLSSETRRAGQQRRHHKDGMFLKMTREQWNAVMDTT